MSATSAGRLFAPYALLPDGWARDVLLAWSGLGYNRRAQALHQTARRLCAEHGGRVPAERGMLLTLPGVGPAPRSR